MIQRRMLVYKEAVAKLHFVNQLNRQILSPYVTQKPLFYFFFFIFIIDWLRC